MFYNSKEYSNFEKVLDGVFGATEVAFQPKFIIQVGAQNPELLVSAFDFVKKNSIRGENFLEAPLEVVALVLNQPAQESISSGLHSVPHRIAIIESCSEEHILLALRGLGITDTSTALLLAYFQNVPFLATPFGWVQWKDCKDTDLLRNAKQGWFPKDEGFYYCREDNTTLIHYEKRSYCISHPVLDDVSELMRIEKSCWPSNILTPKQVIIDRIRILPNEQYIIKENDVILGVLYTQRIREISSLYNSQADTLQNLYDPEGSVIQLISLFIDQRKQFLNLGDRLLEFALQLATLTPNITDVAGVTRCANFPGKEVLSLEEYLKQETEAGELLDPVPRMHINHGALLKKIVPNFRPNDLQNDGCGVVIVYPLAEREENRRRVVRCVKTQMAEELSRDGIAAFVDDAILGLLEYCGGLVQQDNRALYTRTTPLMDMGLDSLQLLELNSKFSDKFSITLEPTFFFQYGTAEAVIRYIIDNKIDLFKDWIYEIQWKENSLSAVSKFISNQVWIIFDSGDAFSDSLRKTLESQGQYCIFVRSSVQFQKIENQVFEVNPESSEDFRRLLKEIPRLSQLAGVLYLWHVQPLSKELKYKDIEETLKANCTSFMYVANALAFSEVPKNAKLWFINYGLITEGSELSLLQAPMTAICKVVREEYPKSHCANLVLDAEQSIEANCAIIAQELAETSTEPQIAWRAGKRFVPRMVQSKVTKFRRSAFDEKGAYLVVGGMRPLGMKIAQWYIDHGAKKIILVDELLVTEEIKSEISRLQKAGVLITTACFALDDFSRWKELIDNTSNVKGVIHAAGVIEQELLMHLSWDRFSHANRLKIASSWALHQLTQGMELDHFVLFSTCLTDFAPTSRAAYLLGNVFLDALSHYRKKRGLASLTVDWGPWAERHMLIHHMTDTTISSRMKKLNIDEGLLVLETILYSQLAQITAAEIDWPQFFKHEIAPNPLFEEIKSRLQVVSREKEVIEDEPIAIVGIGCRFPGGVNTPETFWRIFNEGVDVIAEVPPDRWDIDAYYDSDRKIPGKMYTRYGGFIKNIDLFDPQFFGISPHEAEDMDPQQRISLEVAWEALENAGIVPTTLKGTNTGVFMGICFNDYGQLITQSGDIDAVDDYFSTGNHFSVVAGRISYILGLHGPAMAIDTACSSSLVAVDIACEKIRAGECDMALAGGVNLILAPESTINFCKSNMLAEDGRCKTFDAAANGYVRGEGCGIVVLKKLKDALRDNNPILAVIRATAVNQDGASTGLTVPNVYAQEMLINKALRKAQIESKDVDYVEAHGTGTSLGDPIEVKGIVEVYGQNRDKPLIIGSAKTNIGHTEAAAGVAGLIKCVLALQNAKIPKQLHFHTLNPFIKMDESQVIIAKEAVSWPVVSKKRYAAVSSFGFSGTNSHIIIEEPPVRPEKQFNSETNEFLLVLSAKTQKALDELIQEYIVYLDHTNASISDITYTANLGRAQFEYRVALSGKDKKELLLKLKNSDFTVSSELEGVAVKYRNGESINWQEFYVGNQSKIVYLPNYPFQRQRCWSKSARPQIGKKIAAIHPLVGEVHTNPHEELFFLGQLHLSLLPYLKDHLVYKHLIYPAAAYLEMLLAASRYAFNGLSIQLKNVVVEAALSFPEGKPVDTQVVMTPTDGGYDVSIFSLSENTTWKSHVRAIASQRNRAEELKEVTIENIRSRCQTVLQKADFYKYAHSVGLCIGPAFHTLQNIYVSDSEGLGEIKLLHNEKEYIAHPALLDGCLQLLFVLAWRAGSESLYLPISFDAFELYEPLGDHVFAHWIQGEVTDSGRMGNLTICTPSGKVVAKIEGVRFRKTNESALTQMITHKVDVEDWFYTWSWQEKKLSDFSEQEQPFHWLVLGDTKNASLLQQEVEAKNGKCTLVSLSCLPNSKGDYLDLLRKEEFTGVIHAASMNFSDELSTKNVSEGQKLGAENVLYLVQALLALEDTRKIPAFVLTDNNLVQSPIDGLLKSVFVEHPELRIKQIDLSRDWAPNVALQALYDKSPEPIYAIRGATCFVPRFTRMAGVRTEESYIRSNATYLIAGGLGGLGIELARKLSEMGAGHIILSGRRACSEQEIKDLAIRSKITYEVLDVCNEEAVRGLFEKLQQAEMPLKGIFHLAGEVQDATLAEQDWPHFERVFKSKVYGALNLHQYSKDLDYFVVYSSIAASMGNPGQANYAAANSFMDALCRHRRQKGLAALSIAWSFWSNVGMAKDLVGRHAKTGMIGLAPSDAMRALELLLAFPQLEVTVANINWKTYLK